MSWMVYQATKTHRDYFILGWWLLSMPIDASIIIYGLDKL